MNRLVALAVLAVLLSSAVTSCGSDEGSAFDTLPPIRTTTTTTTTTLPYDDRLRIYTVKEGENLSMIARSFEVPLDTLIEFNIDKLPDPNNVQPGTVLEIPPVVLIEELPTIPPSSEPEDP
jgi:LysM repeat protein